MGTRVILADGQTLRRGAVRALIESASGFEVVAEASDGVELLACIDQHAPDVVIVDSDLPRIDALEVVSQSRQSNTHTCFLLLSSRDGANYIEAALRGGVAGYVSVADSASDLLAAIEAVRRGQTFLSPSATDQLVEIAIGRESRSSQTPELSIREQEVVKMIADGLSNKGIADCLHISVRTVDTHRANVMDKLGIHKVAGLVRYAIRKGLIEP